MGLQEKFVNLFTVAVLFYSVASASFNGSRGVSEECSTDEDCEAGLYCFWCAESFKGSKCVRSTTTDPFKLVNGVRVLLLDTYDFKGDVWLCHSFEGKCHDYTAFEPAVDTLKEVEAFLSANPGEIVTLILEDYVQAPNGLTKVFNDSGLMKYWFPLSQMPQKGQDWPLVTNMVSNNQRLLVFTSDKSKEQTEGIAYQWNYMVENQYGDGGMQVGKCPNRGESAPLDDKTKSLVFFNYFESVPNKLHACVDNSGALTDMLHACYGAAGNRWANFVAVDYYKRSEGGGAFQATDMLNGELLCGCDDVHGCVPGSGSCKSS